MCQKSKGLTRERSYSRRGKKGSLLGMHYEWSPEIGPNSIEVKQQQ